MFEETSVSESNGFDNGNWENRYVVGGGIDKECARIHFSLSLSLRFCYCDRWDEEEGKLVLAAVVVVG